MNNSRINLLKNLQSEQKQKNNQLTELNDQINRVMGLNGCADELFKLCEKRNDLNNDIYYLGRKIDNLKTRNGTLLGEVIQERNDKGN